MGLITEEVWVTLGGRNIKWYEEKGYEIPKRIDNQGRIKIKKGTKILVKVEDLSDGSEVYVDVQCDNCKEIVSKMWCQYISTVHEDGEYYCKKCISPERIELRLKTMLDKSISFYDWCYGNLSKDEADKIILRWDYELNVRNNKVLTPKDVTYSSGGINNKGYWFKCLDHPEHKSEQKRINGFTSGKSGSITCNKCNTISITHPYLMKFLVNKEDAYKYSLKIINI
jgi:predicted SprT family Zn-dependent metalloprotease